jgi:hypothetical protein
MSVARRSACVFGRHDGHVGPNAYQWASLNARFVKVEDACAPSYTPQPHAVVAELADALDSGSSGVKPMEVQVLSTA